MDNKKLIKLIESVYDIDIKNLNDNDLHSLNSMANNIYLDTNRELYKRGQL